MEKKLMYNNRISIVLVVLFMCQSALSMDGKASTLDELKERTSARACQHLKALSEDITLENLNAPGSAWKEAGKYAAVATFIGPLLGAAYYSSKFNEDTNENWMNFFKGLGVGALLLPTAIPAALIFAPPAAATGYICQTVENYRRDQPRQETKEQIWKYFAVLYDVVLETQDEFASLAHDTKMEQLLEYQAALEKSKPSFKKLPIVNISDLLQYGSSDIDQLTKAIMQLHINSKTFEDLSTQDLQQFLGYFEGAPHNPQKAQAALITMIFTYNILNQYPDKNRPPFSIMIRQIIAE